MQRGGFTFARPNLEPQKSSRRRVEPFCTVSRAAATPPLAALPPACGPGRTGQCASRCAGRHLGRPRSATGARHLAVQVRSGRRHQLDHGANRVCLLLVARFHLPPLPVMRARLGPNSPTPAWSPTALLFLVGATAATGSMDSGYRESRRGPVLPGASPVTSASGQSSATEIIVSAAGDLNLGMPACLVPDCGRSASLRGLCQAQYRRWDKAGQRDALGATLWVTRTGPRPRRPSSRRLRLRGTDASGVGSPGRVSWLAPPTASDRSKRRRGRRARHLAT